MSTPRTIVSMFEVRNSMLEDITATIAEMESQGYDVWSYIVTQQPNYNAYTNHTIIFKKLTQGLSL